MLYVSSELPRQHLQCILVGYLGARSELDASRDLLAVEQVRSRRPRDPRPPLPSAPADVHWTVLLHRCGVAGRQEPPAKCFSASPRPIAKCQTASARRIHVQANTSKELGKRLAGGTATNITWILGAVEDIDLSGPYALITAGESLHWMNWDLVMPRFASILTPNGVLAITGRSWDTHPTLRDLELPIIEKHSPVKDYRPHYLIDELRQRSLFAVAGERRFGPESWWPTIDEYLECRHSQRGLSRTHMGEAAVAAFDAELREVLEDLSGLVQSQPGTGASNRRWWRG